MAERGALPHQFTQRVGQTQELKETEPALVTRVVAGRAARARKKRLSLQGGRSEAELAQQRIRGRKSRPASRADPAHEPLGEHPLHGRGQQVRFNPHVHEARDGARGIVGVQGAQHQMAGERSLDGDLGRLEIADFTDHHDIRILSEKSAQGPGERQARRQVDRYLHDAIKFVFDRVLDRDEFCVDGIQDLQAAIEGGGFA